MLHDTTSITLNYALSTSMFIRRLIKPSTSHFSRREQNNIKREHLGFRELTKFFFVNLKGKEDFPIKGRLQKRLLFKGDKY